MESEARTPARWLSFRDVMTITGIAFKVYLPLILSLRLVFTFRPAMKLVGGFVNRTMKKSPEILLALFPYRYYEPVPAMMVYLESVSSLTSYAAIGTLWRLIIGKNLNRDELEYLSSLLMNYVGNDIDLRVLAQICHSFPTDEGNKNALDLEDYIPYLEYLACKKCLSAIFENNHQIKLLAAQVDSEISHHGLRWETLEKTKTLIERVGKAQWPE